MGKISQLPCHRSHVNTTNEMVSHGISEVLFSLVIFSAGALHGEFFWTRSWSKQETEEPELELRNKANILAVGQNQDTDTFVT